MPPSTRSTRRSAFGQSARIARVEQRKAARAVSRFHHARFEAALPDGRGLLIARDAEDAHRPAEQVREGRAELACRVTHLRQQRLRYTKEFEQFVVPLPRADVEQRSARGVGDVGRVYFPTSEVPAQGRVDWAK